MRVAEVKDYFEKLLTPYKHNTYNRRGADLQKIIPDVWYWVKKKKGFLRETLGKLPPSFELTRREVSAWGT